MDPIYWAALLSFVAGACGYIIVRYWILPIGRYKRVKRLLLKTLGELIKTLPQDDEVTLKAGLGKKRMREMRRVSMQLVELSQHDLPYWYRLVLLTRKESASNASEAIVRLENLPTTGQVRRCLNEAAVQLTSPRVLTTIGIDPAWDQKERRMK